MRYRVKVTIKGEAPSGNALTFDSLRAADEYALELLGRWTMPDGYIVEACSLSALIRTNLEPEWEMIATRTRFGALEIHSGACARCGFAHVDTFDCVGAAQ